jgi:hypothetical protein
MGYDVDKSACILICASRVERRILSGRFPANRVRGLWRAVVRCNVHRRRVCIVGYGEGYEVDVHKWPAGRLRARISQNECVRRSAEVGGREEEGLEGEGRRRETVGYGGFAVKRCGILILIVDTARGLGWSVRWLGWMGEKEGTHMVVALGAEEVDSRAIEVDGDLRALLLRRVERGVEVLRKVDVRRVGVDPAALVDKYRGNVID